MYIYIYMYIYICMYIYIYTASKACQQLVTSLVLLPAVGCRH